MWRGHSGPGGGELRIHGSLAGYPTRLIGHSHRLPSDSRVALTVPLLETIARQEERAAETELRDMPRTLGESAGPLPSTLQPVRRVDDAVVVAAAVDVAAAAGSVPSVRADDYSVPAWAQLLTRPSLTAQRLLRY